MKKTTVTHLLSLFILSIMCLCLSACTIQESQLILPEIESTNTSPSTLDSYTNTDTDSVSSDDPLPVVEILTYLPEASGTRTDSSDYICIDYSNANQGYIMVQYLGSHTEKIKFQITGPDELTYTYDLTVADDYQTFPLTSGSGTYSLTLNEQESGTTYQQVYSTFISIDLDNEFLPFLYPNQLVNYTQDSSIVALSIDAATDVYSQSELVTNICYSTISLLEYNETLANIINNGELESYIPDLEAILSEGNGICLDYASLMVAMLRIQEIPSQLVIGYVDNTYHAWINVYTEDSGWNIIDPTFCYNNQNKNALTSFFDKDANYIELYLY